jgi:hypothetical protein
VHAFLHPTSWIASDPRLYSADYGFYPILRDSRKRNFMHVADGRENPSLY